MNSLNWNGKIWIIMNTEHNLWTIEQGLENCENWRKTNNSRFGPHIYPGVVFNSAFEKCLPLLVIIFFSSSNSLNIMREEIFPFHSSHFVSSVCFRLFYGVYCFLLLPYFSFYFYDIRIVSVQYASFAIAIHFRSILEW